MFPHADSKDQHGGKVAGGTWISDRGQAAGGIREPAYYISHAADMNQLMAVHEPDAAYPPGIENGENSGLGDLTAKHIKVTASMRVRQKFTGGGQGFYYPERSKITAAGG